jgi:hypothetical protein
MIAGNANATSPQPVWTTTWFCAYERGGYSARVAAPDCPERFQVVLNVVFPDCWDGTRLDSADHKSHLTYARRGWGSVYAGCPASHPVPLPSITLKVVYPTRGGPDAELASGGVNSAHADFLDGWERAAIEELVRDCIRAGVDCPAG